MSKISIRPVRTSDEHGLVEFYAGLSAESRRARFLGCSSGISAGRATMMSGADHRHDEGFVATRRSGVRRSIVGHLMLAQTDPGVYEVAVAVADDCQGAGIGRRLFEAGIGWAVEHGAERLVASAFVDNWRVLRLLSSSPYGANVTHRGDGVVSVVIPLAAGDRNPLALPPAA